MFSRAVLAPSFFVAVIFSMRCSGTCTFDVLTFRPVLSSFGLSCYSHIFGRAALVRAVLTCCLFTCCFFPCGFVTLIFCRGAILTRAVLTMLLSGLLFNQSINVYFPRFKNDEGESGKKTENLAWNTPSSPQWIERGNFYRCMQIPSLHAGAMHCTIHNKQTKLLAYTIFRVQSPTVTFQISSPSNM